MSTAAYDALSTEARNNLTLLTRFQTDLHQHDHACLTALDAPKRFGWILTESGTHLVRDDCAEEGIKAYRNSFNPLTGQCRSAGDRFYTWNGRKLSLVTHREMFRRLNEWRGENLRRAA